MAIIAQTPLTIIQQAAVEYVEAGLVIVPVRAKSKKAAGKGWNLKENAIFTADKAAKMTGNVGLANLWARVAVVDLDDLASAIPYLSDNGVDVVTMLMADPVQISSGRPNRAKLLYRLPDGEGALPTFQHANPDGKMVVELRCADQSGTKTMMDVLPPSIHPDTGQSYTWIGDWHNIPKMPKPLLDFWQSIAPVKQLTQAKLSTGSDRPYLEQMATIPRTNICSRYGAVKGQVKPLKSGVNATPELLKEEDVLRQVLPFMGFTDVASLFTKGRVSVTCPYREDNHKSGGLIRADDGWVLFKDFGDPNEITYTLARLWATIVSGKIQNLNKVSSAVWTMRLLIESGVISPATVTLPSFTGSPAEMKFYNGVALLFQCRWRYAPHKGEPIMIAREFMADWCGVGITTAHSTKNKLVKLKVLRQYNQKRRGFLFAPYTTESKNR